MGGATSGAVGGAAGHVVANLHMSRPCPSFGRAVTQSTNAGNFRGATPHHKCAVSSASSMSRDSCAAESESTFSCPKLMCGVFVQEVPFYDPLSHI